ncbi:XK-related protein 6-like [Crassostrea virginica]
MNTEIRKSKVILTRRLAQQLKTDENETTLENFSNGANGHTEERGTSSKDEVDNLVGERVNTRADLSEAVDSSIGNRSDDLKKPSNQFYPFSAIDFININVSVVFFCLDFLTDILLAKDYYDEGKIFECALTSSLVAASFLVTGILSSFWHAQEKPRRNLCLVFLTFPFATIERNITYAFHGCKSKQKGTNEYYHYIEMIYTDRDASLLRMFDAFIESAPQLVLQIYLILKEQENMESCEDIEVHSHILRLITVLSSWVSVSWSVTSYYRALRVSNAMHTTQQRTLLAAAGYFMWRVFEIGPRVVALVLIILMNPIIFLLTVVFHYFAVVTWSFASKAMPYEKLHENIVFVLCIGFVQVFSFMNTSPGKSRYHALLYYTFFYIENIVILILWIVLKKESFCPWIYHGAVGIVASGIIMNLVFIACFYKLCHPKTGII